MSKTLIIILVVVTLLALVGGGLAWAKRQGFCHHSGADWLRERIARRLDLNEGQREKLKQLGQQLTGLKDQWLEARNQGRSELLALLDAPSLDRERATSLLEARQQAWQELTPGLVTAFADFSDSLSTEQRARLRGMVDHRRGFCCHR